MLTSPVGQDIISLSNESDNGSDMGSTMNNSLDPGYNISKVKDEEESL